MSNTMASAHGHEPISYLDSVISEEERRCEYSHQWRNFTISRSGRFKSKNKKRDIVDGKLFDAHAGGHGGNDGGGSASATAAASAAAAITATTTNTSSSLDDRVYRIGVAGGTASTGNYWELDKNKAHRQLTAASAGSTYYHHKQQPSASATTTQHSAAATRGIRDKAASYKSYYETNL